MITDCSGQKTCPDFTGWCGWWWVYALAWCNHDPHVVRGNVIR